MLRTAYHDNMFQWAPGPDTHGDTDSELALAPFRPKNPRDPAAVYAEQIARLEKWRTAVGAGKPAAIAPPRPLLSFNGIQVPAALTAANVIPVDSRRPATPPAAATSPSASSAPAAGLDDLYEGPDLSVLNPRQRRVYDAVVGGARSNAEMIDRTELPAPAVSKALKMLAGLGYVHKIRHGAWAPGPGRNAGDASATAHCFAARLRRLGIRRARRRRRGPRRQHRRVTPRGCATDRDSHPATAGRASGRDRGCIPGPPRMTAGGHP